MQKQSKHKYKPNIQWCQHSNNKKQIKQNIFQKKEEEARFTCTCILHHFVESAAPHNHWAFENKDKSQDHTRTHTKKLHLLRTVQYALIAGETFYFLFCPRQWMWPQNKLRCTILDSTHQLHTTSAQLPTVISMLH